jgi:hypothetical protein
MSEQEIDAFQSGSIQKPNGEQGHVQLESHDGCLEYSFKKGPNTLTPAEATAVVMNGGLVVSCGKTFYSPQEGWYKAYRDYAITSLPFEKRKNAHPLYDPAIFALTFPLTLPGPEAKALLMKAPVGMLWGCYGRDTGSEKDWDDYAEYWDGQQFVNKHSRPYRWLECSAFEIRLRPGWLDSQREKFARGEFGEAITKQGALPYVDDKESNMLDLTQFPKTMKGAEAKALIMAHPAGLLEGQFVDPWTPAKDSWGYRTDIDTFHPGTWVWNNELFTVRVRNAATGKETLTAGQALDALIAGGCEFVGRDDVRWVPDDINGEDDIQLYTFIESAPFTRVPAKPVSKPLTLDNGLVVTVYADRVEADVPGCGKWASTRERYETALKCEGMTSVRVRDFAQKKGQSLEGEVWTEGVIVSDRTTITFTDIHRVLAAMQEVAG